MILERGIQVTVKYLNMVHLHTISLPLYEVWGSQMDLTPRTALPPTINRVGGCEYKGLWIKPLSHLRVSHINLTL